MSVISPEELKNFLKSKNLICYSKDIFLLDKRNIKIETEINFRYSGYLELTATHRDLFYDELVDDFDKRIFYNLGDIHLDESLMVLRFEKLIESDFVKFDFKTTKDLLEHTELQDHIRSNIKINLVSRDIVKPVKDLGYIFGLKRYIVDIPHMIKIVYLDRLPTIENFRKLFKLSRLPLLDNQRFQDDRYIEQLLECLIETLDIEFNDLAKGVDLGIEPDTSLSRLEKLGIFGLTIPGVNLFLERNSILPA